MNARLLLAALALLALAATGYLLFADPQQNQPPGPRSGRGADSAEIDPSTDEPSRGATRRAVETGAEPDSPSETTSTENDASGAPTPVADDAPTEPTGGLRIHAIEATSNDFLTSFRIVPVTPTPALPNERLVEFDVEFRLALEPGERCSFRVEADGYVPSDPLTETRLPTEAWRDVDVRLVPATRATGVRVLIRDDRLTPVDHLRVVASRHELGTPGAPYTEAWTRENKAADGSYELPDLQPGSWRLKLVALDGDGNPRPLLPASVEFDQDGGARVERAVDLEPGALLSLEVRDQTTGQPLDRVPVRLERTDGTEVATRWVHRDADDGHRTVAQGGLPAAGRSQLEDPIRPGGYTLKVQLPDGTILERPLQLLPGGREDLTLP